MSMYLSMYLYIYIYIYIHALTSISVHMCMYICANKTVSECRPKQNKKNEIEGKNERWERKRRTGKRRK